MRCIFSFIDRSKLLMPGQRKKPCDVVSGADALQLSADLDPDDAHDVVGTLERVADAEPWLELKSGLWVS